MTKAELISALEWFKDDAELHIVVSHEALDDIHEVLSLDSARYNLIPPRVELVAKRSAPETPPALDMSSRPMGDPHPIDLVRNRQCPICGGLDACKPGCGDDSEHF